MDNEAAAEYIDQQLKILLQASGLRTDELVRLPVLFERVPGYGLLKAMTPGLVNGGVEDFFWANVGGGGVLCAANALRDTNRATPWWVSSGGSAVSDSATR